MSINNGKHIVAEIESVRCTIIESGISKERMEYLKGILEFNGLVVKTEMLKKAETDAETFTIGITDLTLNPVIAIYQKRFKLPNGKNVTPEIWKTNASTPNTPYWILRNVGNIQHDIPANK